MGLVTQLRHSPVGGEHSEAFLGQDQLDPVTNTSSADGDGSGNQLVCFS